MLRIPRPNQRRGMRGGWHAPRGLATLHEALAQPQGFAAKPRPFGVSFAGMACSEPRLIELAYAFEQAGYARKPPLKD